MVYVSINGELVSMSRDQAASESRVYIKVANQHELRIMIPVFFLYAKISIHTRVGNTIIVVDHSDVIPFAGISEFLTKNHFLDIDSRNVRFLFQLADSLDIAIHSGLSLSDFANSLKATH